MSTNLVTVCHSHKNLISMQSWQNSRAKHMAVKRLPGGMRFLLLSLIQDQLILDITVPIFEASQNANGIASMILPFVRYRGMMLNVHMDIRTSTGDKQPISWFTWKSIPSRLIQVYQSVLESCSWSMKLSISVPVWMGKNAPQERPALSLWPVFTFF